MKSERFIGTGTFIGASQLNVLPMSRAVIMQIRYKLKQVYAITAEESIIAILKWIAISHYFNRLFMVNDLTFFI